MTFALFIQLLIELTVLVAIIVATVMAWRCAVALRSMKQLQEAEANRSAKHRATMEKALLRIEEVVELEAIHEQMRRKEK